MGEPSSSSTFITSFVFISKAFANSLTVIGIYHSPHPFFLQLTGGFPLQTAPGLPQAPQLRRYGLEFFQVALFLRSVLCQCSSLQLKHDVFPMFENWHPSSPKAAGLFPSVWLLSQPDCQRLKLRRGVQTPTVPLLANGHLLRKAGLQLCQQFLWNC